MRQIQFSLIPKFFFCACSLALLPSLALAGPKYPSPTPPSKAKHLHASNFDPPDHDPGPVAVTPEPASLIVLGSGLLVVGAALRRRNKMDMQDDSVPASTFRNEFRSPAADSEPH
jgi:PEP-CTERM motif